MNCIFNTARTYYLCLNIIEILHILRVMVAEDESATRTYSPSKEAVGLNKKIEYCVVVSCACDLAHVVTSTDGAH